MGEFTHFNNLGEAVMVDVSDKKETVDVYKRQEKFVTTL